MNLSRNPLIVLAVCGAAVSASAQDSVSQFGGQPGDALDPYRADTQVTDFVVDLSPIFTSWGTEFGVAPILKYPGVPGSGFFNLLSGGTTISPDLLEEVPFPASSYALWTSRGGGVNPDTNNLDLNTMITPASATSSQFTLAINGFSTLSSQLGDNTEAITGALVNYDPAEPSRLYVRRVDAAVNQPTALDPKTGSMGLGSADAAGNVYFRADDSEGTGVTSGVFTAFSNNNLLGVDISLRTNGIINTVSGNPMTGEPAATFRFAENVGTTTNPGVLYVPPSNVPSSVAGQRVISTANFDQENVRGPLGSVVNAMDYVAAGDTEETRGSIRTINKAILGSGVATSAIVVKSFTEQAFNDFRARSINIWSVDSDGTPIDRIALEMPFVLTDNTTDPAGGAPRTPAFEIDYDFGFSVFNQFRQYTGPAPFRSPTGPVAIGQDQQGRGLAAAVNSEFGEGSDAFVQMPIVRFNPDGSGAEWTMVAWLDTLNPVGGAIGITGKPILDGPGGNVIGRLVDLPTRTNFALAAGNAFSAPVIDSVGNVWFLSSVVLGSDQDIITGNVAALDFDTALIRAVYDADNFSYELELVADLGEIITGQNSATDYVITFYPLVTGTGNDLSPSSMYSGSGRSTAWNNVDTTGLDTADPITNGGIIVNASVIYNTDDSVDPMTGFQTFVNPADDPTSPDEAYNVLLYFGYNGEGIIVDPGPCSIADLDGNNLIDVFDLIAFLQNFDPNASCPGDAACAVADLDGNDAIDVFDLIAFLQNFDPNDPNCQG